MEKEENRVIHVTTFGTFTIQLGDRRICDTDTHSKKPWFLLEYLIIFRKRAISHDELTSLIWGEDDSTISESSLKTLMFRSRKLLEPLQYPAQSLITQKNGTYAWTKELTTVVDIDLFEELAEKALNPEIPAEMRLDCCLQAIDLYKGEFLTKSGWESWVVPLASYYHNLYQKVVMAAIALLSVQKNDSKIIELCQKALTFSPYDEDLHYHLIYSLYCNGQQQKAMEHYSHATDLLSREFSVTLSNRPEFLYKSIRNAAHGITLDLNHILESFLNDEPPQGAYYCEPSLFRDIFQIEKRSIERTGAPAFLCLLTMVTSNIHLANRPVLIRSMTDLGEAISHSMHRGDVYCRYSAGQYLLLLQTDSYENCETAIRSVVQNFHTSGAPKDLRIAYSIRPVLPDSSVTDNLQAVTESII